MTEFPRQTPNAITTAAELLHELRARGVQLIVAGDRLRAVASAGVIDSDLQAAIGRWKSELIALIAAEPTPETETTAAETPITAAQERLWLFQQLEPDAATYNVFMALRLEGALDAVRLEHAIRRLLGRHELLHCVVGATKQGGTIRPVDIPVHIMTTIDVSHLSGDAQAVAVQAHVKDAQLRPFNLEHDIPFRATLLRLEADRHVLLVCTHHIAVDGVSIQYLVRDLATFYRGDEPAALRTTFREHAAWQRRYWTPEHLAQRAEFWRTTLAGAPLVLELPTDRSRGGKPRYSGGATSITLDTAAEARINALAQSERASLFMALLAAYAAGLHRQSGQRDLVVGTPLHGREQPDLSDLVGMFVNQLPLRMRVGRGDSYRDLLRQARETALHCMTEHEMPFGALVDALGVPRDETRTPVFQALLNVSPPKLATVADTVAGVKFVLPSAEDLLSLFDGQSKFDLTLYAAPVAEGLQLALVYNADLFDATRMRNVLVDMADVLRLGSERPDAPIDELLVRTEATPWQRRLAAAGATTSAQSVPEQVARIAELFGDRPALIGDDREIPYATVQRESQRIARAVVAATPADADRPVGVMMPHDVTAVMALLGVLRSGRPYVPLDPAYPDDRLRFMVQDAGIHVILTSTDLFTKATALIGDDGLVVTVSDEPPTDTALPPMPQPDATAYLLYTSGSTGKPKAVLQSHANLLQQVTRYADALSFAPADRLAWLASISFDASLMDVFGGLVTGASVCPIDPRAADFTHLPAQLTALRLTVLHVTPTVFRTIARSAITPEFPTVRAVVLGGEAVRPDDVQFFDEHFASDALLFNLYGASEHSFSLGFAIDRHARSVEVPIGWPVGDTEVLLFDADGQPDAVSGELVLRSKYSAHGYWNAPALASVVFTPDPREAGVRLYRSGDLVRRRSDGAFVYLGRADQQLKVRGHRIEAYEVESVLQAHPGIAEAAVHAPRDPVGDAMLMACVVLRPITPAPSMAELAAWCAERLPGFMVPTGWHVMERLPRTPSGKLDRRSLPATATLVAAPQESTNARDAIEAEILQVVRDILVVSGIGVHDDFFALGGHSLSAMQVVSRVRESFDVELPLRRFFDYPTVAHTASWVRDNRHTLASLPPLDARDKGERTPLSFSQERMWFLQQLDPAGTAYNMASAMLIQGPLDVERFRRAMYAVAMQQESLRTRFAMSSGRPAQVVASAPDHAFDIADVSAFPDGERFDRAYALARACVFAPYDLENGPLCRVLAVRLADQRHLVVIGFHHAISDLWSFAVIGRLLREAYERDGDITPRIGVTYRDYALWQRDWLDGDALRAQVEYWREKLHGVATLELPTDLPRPAFMTFAGDTVRTPISSALRERLRQFSTAQRATPFMTLLAVFNTLMAKYSTQTDIAVGVPIAGRRVTATQELIGSFVNTLVHRNNLGANPTFRELVQQVRSTALDAYAHQDAPFELLVKELQPARTTSRSPLFQVLFNVANVRTDGVVIAGIRQELVPLNSGAAQFDLTMNVGLNELQSNLQLTYNTNLFVRTTAERWLAEYAELLERAIANPELRVRELQQLSASDRARQLVEWNATARPRSPNESVLALITDSARLHASSPAVNSPTGAFTYAELIDYAQRVAAALQSLGIRRGDRVAILMQRSREMLGALLGILCSGASYVPIDPNYPEPRVRFMLDDSGASALVTHRDLERRFPTDVPLLDLDTWVPPAPALFVPVAPEQTAYVIYTSGSTGNPKGVDVSHGGMANFLAAMREQPGMSAADVLLAVTTISFDIAVLELFLPLLAGGRVVIAGEADTLDGRRLLRLLDTNDITVMQGTPATWKLLLAAGWRGRRSLRILCGGEALSRSLADELLARSTELWNMYGPTETTVWSTLDRVTASDPILVGRPIANTTVYVLDDHRQPRPVGVAGELYIGGAGVANGYLNRADLTRDRFIDSPFRTGERLYRTGDLVRYHHDGRLEHLGRLDDQVKVRGFRIELGEVETALRADARVRDAVVAAKNDRLIGYVVFESGQHATSTELRSAVSGVLPSHMVPALFVVLNSLPLTANGKVDRKALPDPDAQVEHTGAWEAPADEASRAIADVWMRLLGVSRVGLNDNFFEIGGHSLLAMESVALIEQRTGHRLEPRSLFFMTVRELAAVLQTSTGEE